MMASQTPLERYGQHEYECLKRGGEHRFYGQCPCSCGLDAAIKAEAERPHDEPVA